MQLFTLHGVSRYGEQILERHGDKWVCLRATFSFQRMTFVYIMESYKTKHAMMIDRIGDEDFVIVFAEYPN